ncbi:MAG TPA: diguanylate cyclase [Cyanobacteria bacterium UBA8543]|nr:diguanylate cyclase [Cyanobacteria bacterium UBA8543]
MLHGENLLTFDPPKGGSKGGWQWDIVEIKAQDITDNVVKLLLRQLQKLPEVAQQILSIAACVGAEFDLETLAIVCEKSRKTISQDLLAVIQAGLIQPLSDLDENLLVQEYKFSHDRVQQAAYALINESHKQVVHLQIGRNLLEKNSPEQLSDRLFAIVDHLNQGIELVNAQPERTEIARLNLIAAQKAKAAIAYNMTQNYLATGRAWLSVSSWQTNYQLTLDFYLETTEVEYLCGNFEQVEYWAALILQEAKTVLDTVKVYEVKIQAYMAQSQPLKAIDIALQVLKQLGICFPEKPSQSDIQLELDAIASLLSEKPIEDLIYLPQMTEPDKLAVMQILSRITVAAWIASPDLMPLLVSKQVNLSIQYGNALVSLFAYALYGLILCGIVRNIESGYQFGQLALKLLSQSNLHSLRSKTLFIVNISIIHWKKDGREMLQPLLEGYQSGLETGDLEFAAYCAQGYCNQCYFSGIELVEVERNMATYSEAIRQIKQEGALTWLQIFQQTTANLMGRSLDPYRLVGKFYNEENGSSKHSAANDGTAIFCVYFSKLFLHYLLSEYVRAVEYAAIAENYLNCVTSAGVFVVYYLYNSLAKLAIYSESSAQVQSEILRKVARSQEEMKQWAHYAPMNYLHKYYLVEAEKARVLGQLLEAEEFYEQAIVGAKDNNYLQEEALAYELAAKFYLSRGRKKIAQTYMKEAHYCYDRWGATAKVKDLEKRYPQLLNSNLIRQSHSILTDDTIHRPTAAIDLAAVMKAAQALSEMIHLDQLIATLMQVVIENAGAETGALILLEDDQLTVVAQCSGSRHCHLENIAVAGCATIPISVIHSVERTSETLVFDDALSEPSFLTDSYIQNQQTRSLLCMPILKQNQLIGILYLENNLSTGVFTSDRLQVLKLLIAQAAISLENARLYERLEDYAETLERKVEERTQALQQEINERKQAQSALQRSEAKFRNIFENSQVGIFRTRLSDGLILDANQRLANLIGFDSPEEMIGLEHSINYYPNPSDRQQAIELIKRHGKLQSLEVQLRKRDGTLFWGLYSSRLNAADECIEGVITDISDLKQAEAALQASETELRTLIAAIPDPLFVLTAEGKVLEMTVVEPHLRCQPTEEMIGKTMHQLGKEQADEFVGYIQQVLRTQQILTVEYSIFLDGRETWISSRIAPFGHKQVIWLARDITALKQTEAALRDREQELRLITDALPVCICYVDINQRYQFVNHTYEVWTGYSREEILGKHSRELLGEAAYKIAEPYINRALAGQMTTYEAEIPYPFGKKYISATFIPDFDANAQVRGYYGLIADISDRKQAEIALQASEAELRAFVSAIPDQLCVLTAEGQIIEMAEGKLHRPIEENICIGKTLHQIFEKAQADEFLNYIQQVLRTQQVLTVEYSRWMGGRETWLSARIAPIRHQQVIWLTRDITALKQAEEASILEERNRMAREIHDTLAQAFTGILIQVGAATQVLTDEPEATQAHLDTIEELARTGLSEARRSVKALRPQLLESGDLSSALQRLVNQMKAATDTALIYESQGIAYPLPAEVEHNLLRIGQEALTNAIKYAEASEICVELVYNDGQCILRIKDDGQGFGVGSVPLSSGFGLLGMSERAEHIRAQLKIESQPGQGTEIVVIVNRDR